VPLEGLKELDKKLGELGAKLGGKTLRSASLKATTPTVRKMKIKIPVGDKAHRTYRGRLVAPGFARRSIRRRSRFRGGKSSVSIGVRKEAFYAVNFLDKGATVTTRKINGKRKTIKPYRLTAHHWFKDVFTNDRRKKEDNLARQLKLTIEKVRRRG